jgi:very-short-patch-repair endonuclease
LEALGFKIIRFENIQVFESLEEVLIEIANNFKE